METGQPDFWQAIETGDVAAVGAALDRQPSLLQGRNASGLSPVLTAVYYDQPVITDLLIRRGAPLDLFEASAAGRLEQVRELIEADPGGVNSFAPDGFQPLGLASFFGHLELVEYFLAQGAEVNTPSRNGLRVRPLNSAAAGQRLEIARLLLEHGADANARQGEDFTPLHAAAENGQVEMVRLLLDHGADPRAAAGSGRTPADLAREAGHAQAAQVLEEAGS
jgi:ankyrin repeat protein